MGHHPSKQGLFVNAKKLWLTIFLFSNNRLNGSCRIVAEYSINMLPIIIVGIWMYLFLEKSILGSSASVGSQSKRMTTQKLKPVEVSN